MNNFIKRFAAPDKNWSVLVEIDEKVGYAYLLGSGDCICGDVWLYNRKAAPIDPEWSDPKNAPFANSHEYVDVPAEFADPVDPVDIRVEWSRDGGKWFANIFLGQLLVALLAEGSKPGWSNLVKRDGPLARRLTDESRKNPEIPCS